MFIFLEFFFEFKFVLSAGLLNKPSIFPYYYLSVVPPPTLTPAGQQAVLTALKSGWKPVSLQGALFAGVEENNDWPNLKGTPEYKNMLIPIDSQ